MKHPNAKDIWASLADVARRESLVFTLCPIVGILQSLSSNAFPTGLTHRISKGVTLHTSCARYECMGTLYHKLVAFIPAKDERDFCRRVLKGCHAFEARPIGQAFVSSATKLLKPYLYPPPPRWMGEWVNGWMGEWVNCNIKRLTSSWNFLQCHPTWMYFG